MMTLCCIQMRIIKQRLLEMIPELFVFLEYVHSPRTQYLSSQMFKGYIVRSARVQRR